MYIDTCNYLCRKDFRVPENACGFYNRSMDGLNRKQFEDDISSFEQDLAESDMNLDVKNGFLKTVGFMKRMHADTQMAHMRIDHRKDEMESMKKSIENLTDSISDMSVEIKKLTQSQKGLESMYRKNLQLHNMQMERMHSQNKRMTVYITIISLISLVGTFGSIKGATAASAIWKVINSIL